MHFGDSVEPKVLKEALSREERTMAEFWNGTVGKIRVVCCLDRSLIGCYLPGDAICLYAMKSSIYPFQHINGTGYFSPGLLVIQQQETTNNKRTKGL